MKQNDLIKNCNITNAQYTELITCRKKIYNAILRIVALNQKSNDLNQQSNDNYQKVKENEENEICNLKIELLTLHKQEVMILNPSSEEKNITGLKSISFKKTVLHEENEENVFDESRIISFLGEQYYSIETTNKKIEYRRLEEIRFTNTNETEFAKYKDKMATSCILRSFF